MEVRAPAVAGMFYPADPIALRESVRALMARAASDAAPAATACWPKALIVPHAGYVYSGSTAAQAYAQLAAGRDVIRRVVLLGPVHRVPVRGLALPGASAFATPLGAIPLDAEAAREKEQAAPAELLRHPEQRHAQKGDARILTD